MIRYIMKKLICVLVFVVLIACLFAGCAKNDNNAVILNDNASEFIREDFYSENHTRGAIYDDGASADLSYPNSRYFIVRNQEDYDRIFTSDADFKVNFTSEMLVVYTYTSIYVREIEIKESKTEADRLNMVLATKKPSALVADACQPFQRYVIIKVEAQDISTADIRID